MPKLQNSPGLSSLLEHFEGKEVPKGLREVMELRARMTPEETEEYQRMLEREREEQTRQLIRETIEHSASARIRRSGIPEAYREANLELFQGKGVWSTLVAYESAIANGGHEGLVMRGDVGTGKTTAGCAILNRIVKKKSVRFITFYRFVMLMNDVFIHRTRSREEVFNEYAEVPVLMIDDLGKELTSQNAKNAILMLWSIIDWRRGAMKPTIVTTQYASDDLYKLLMNAGGDQANARAIVDRLKEYVNIPFEGSSLRVQAKLPLERI